MRLSLGLIVSLLAKSVVASPAPQASASVARRDIPLGGAGDLCFENEECASGICLDHRCRLKDIQAECYYGDQCQSGECRSEQCTPLKNGGKCTKDYDCRSRFCSDEACTSALGKSCTTASENDSWEDCRGYNCSPEGKCVEYSYLDDSCQADWQCRVGQCTDGKCKRPSGTRYTTCSGSNQCDEGLVCKYVVSGGKECEPGTPGEWGADCKHDNHCQEGLECGSNMHVSGICVKKDNCRLWYGSCSKDEDCCGSSNGSVSGRCQPILHV